VNTPTFEFITDKDFRNVLEADYAEVCKCMDTGAHKAVHVLAGSIIEALLVDCLVALPVTDKSKEALCRMELGQLVARCKAEGVLSEKTEQLSSVVRAYRNLIHAGRVVRGGEIVDENTAIVAKALIGIIVDEVAKKRRETYGYTAEQILTKVEHDVTSPAIIGRVLREAKRCEVERLLLSVIPVRFAEIYAQPDLGYEMREQRKAVARCFRVAFDSVPTDVKSRVSKSFVATLKQDPGPIVLAFETYLFRPSDLSILSPDDRALVLDHLISRFENDHDEEFVGAMAGIGRYLSERDIPRFINALTAPTWFLWNEYDTSCYLSTRDFLQTELHALQDAVRLAASPSIHNRVEYYRNMGYADQARCIERSCVFPRPAVRVTAPVVEIDDSDPFADE